jgi:hypothetical protein
MGMHPRSLVVALFLVFAGSAALFGVQSDDGRWSLAGGGYRQQVIAQPTPPRSDLKHIEWGGWGWAGQNTTVFLVYDPTDKLARAVNTKPGKGAGIPCEVPSIRAPERSWYIVTFYTGADWDNCSP